MDLPVAERWFRMERVAPDLTLLVERHLDCFFEYFGRAALLALIDGELRRRG
jgi:hypothetical protein